MDLLGFVDTDMGMKTHKFDPLPFMHY